MPETRSPTTSFYLTAVILGLLTAVGPFAIDMYLPALPSIEKGLDTDTATVQLSLLSFFVAMSLSQLVYGPLADIYGRKRPLFLGLVLYLLGAVGSAMAPDIWWLIAARALQGLGAASGMVIARAVVRDLHTGPDAAQLMATLMLVVSVAPVLAPLGGSMVLAIGDWRMIFWAMALAAIAAIVLLTLALTETRPPEKRGNSSVTRSLKDYGSLLRDPKFLGVVFVAAFAMASFMTYVANSSFILIGHYGLSPTHYSLAFSINAAGFIGVAQLSGFLSRRIGLGPMMRFAITANIVIMLSLLLVMMAGVAALPVMIIMLFCGYACLGLVVPSAAELALDEHGEKAGTASALMGTLQFMTAAVMIAAVMIGIAGLFFDGTPVRMIAAIATCSIVAFVLAMVSVPRGRFG
ncbi:MAG: Bcr/CflA family drug resistance efflux transporter [Ahrensia sp.]|nr:Bcr/CflA family drug resistance efflux transporter [Ahrensia sp.]